jgi:hypothetical protein
MRGAGYHEGAWRVGSEASSASHVSQDPNRFVDPKLKRRPVLGCVPFTGTTGTAGTTRRPPDCYSVCLLDWLPEWFSRSARIHARRAEGAAQGAPARAAGDGDVGGRAVGAGLGRIVALHCHSSASYQNH